MNKLVILVLAFAIAAPALADDLIPPPQNPETGVGESWRGDPGSTYSQWTYNDPCGVYDWDFPEVSSFVSHPEKEDPTFPWDPCQPYFSGQVWGVSIDPCVPTYYDALPGGRQGGVSLNMASWDVGNFVHDQPAKDIWVQITYLVQGGGYADPCFFGAGGFGPGDPCNAEDWGGVEAPLTEWDYETFGEPQETWDEGGAIGFSEWPLAEWPSTDPCDAPHWTWEDLGAAEFWADGEMVNRSDLADGWVHEVWAMTLELNPEYEWIEFGYADGTGVLLDQIVIETLCYVPEPATMVLLGLGSLMMIRRKKK